MSSGLFRSNVGHVPSRIPTTSPYWREHAVKKPRASRASSKRLPTTGKPFGPGGGRSARILRLSSSCRKVPLSHPGWIRGRLAHWGQMLNQTCSAEGGLSHSPADLSKDRDTMCPNHLPSMSAGLVEKKGPPVRNGPSVGRKGPRGQQDRLEIADQRSVVAE